jgi:hypothetical protein
MENIEEGKTFKADRDDHDNVKAKKLTKALKKFSKNQKDRAIQKRTVDDRVDEEVETLDELDWDSHKILGRYINKTRDNPDRKEGRALALKKRWGDAKYGLPEPKVKAVDRSANEEVEQVDEISKDAAGNYIKSAKMDLYGRGIQASDTRVKQSTRLRGASNRAKGINLAVDKLSGHAKVNTKEEVEELNNIEEGKTFKADRDDHDENPKRLKKFSATFRKNRDGKKKNASSENEKHEKEDE